MIYAKYWRASLVAIFSCYAAQASYAADVVRITAINGNYDLNHSQVLTVQPGDIVSLSADLFSDYDTNGMNRPIEEFRWSSNENSNDFCDAAYKDNCIGSTNFEVTDYGVNFYVPYSMNREISIAVENSYAQGSQDVLTLVNGSFGDNYTPPNEVVTRPDEYKGDVYDPNRALAGQGRWITIGESRYFAPYPSQTDWEPYRNGYWVWVENDGWTWQSNDPWGWLTDHYGVWRHHNSYGWIWLQFNDRRYRPHTVTWFNDNDYIGWYPYCDEYREGYRQGYSDGFDDGFWSGYRAGHFYTGTRDFGYHGGFTVVRYDRFNSRNIYDVYDRDRCRDVFRTSYRETRYGMHPGAHSNLDHSRVWLNGRLISPVPVTSRYERNIGDFRLRGPREVYPMPSRERMVPGMDDRFRRPMPIGSVIRPPLNPGERPRIDRPIGRPVGSDPSRGIGMPPRGMPNRPMPGNPGQQPGRPQQPNRPMPGNPGQQPGRPEQPNRPMPGNPGQQPGRPEQPNRPMPGNPGQQPGRPEQPNRPMPGNPGQQPGRPEQPNRPMPGNPGQQPGRPEQPNRPMPGNPGQQPGRPEQPNRPMPGNPGQQPGRPEQPNRPMPGNPGQQPGRPEQPSRPQPQPQQPSRPQPQPQQPSRPQPQPQQPSRPQPQPQQPSRPQPQPQQPSRPQPQQPSRPSPGSGGGGAGPSRPSPQQPSRPSPGSGGGGRSGPSRPGPGRPGPGHG